MSERKKKEDWTPRSNIRTTGQLRDFLCETMEKVRSRLIDAEEANKVAQIAARVNESFFAEVKIIRTQQELGGQSAKLGDLMIDGSADEP
jgi:hypothetical protein